MIERRSLMHGGLAAGVSALAGVGGAEASQCGDELQPIVVAIDNLRAELTRQFDVTDSGPWRAIGRIRDQQRIWLRSTQKYPHFMEVGIDVWDQLHDWHVRNAQPLNVARLPDGRYSMLFSFTTLILRTDAAVDFIGVAFDIERQP